MDVIKDISVIKACLELINPNVFRFELLDEVNSSYVYEVTLIQEAILSKVEGHSKYLELYSKDIRWGIYQKLSLSLLSYLRGDSEDTALSEDERENVVTTIEFMLGRLFWDDNKLSNLLIPLRSYVDELIDLMAYINDYFGRFTELFLDTSFKDLDKDKLKKNFLGFRLFDEDTFMFYTGLINQGIIPKLNNWEDIKLVMLNTPHSLLKLNKYQYILYDFNSLEDYQIEFLLELECEDNELLKRACVKNLRIPKKLIPKAEEMKLGMSVKHLRTIDDVITAFPSLSLSQKQYLFNKLTKENTSYVQLGHLPVCIPEVEMRFIQAGMTDIVLNCVLVDRVNW